MRRGAPVRALFTKLELKSPNFTLPSPSIAPKIVKDGLFTWSLQPYIENEERVIKLSCSKCSKFYLLHWPIHTTNPRLHYENNHVNVISQELILNHQSENGHLILLPHTSEASSSKICTAQTGVFMRKKRPSSFFDEDEFKKVFLKFFIATNQTTQVLGSPSLLDLMDYLIGYVPAFISRSSIRCQLEDMQASAN